MARPIDPAEPPSEDPTDPGYTPPTGPGTKIAFVVAGSAATITSDQIAAAGGPWPAFKVRVTPFNNAGPGPSTEVIYPPPP